MLSDFLEDLLRNARELWEDFLDWIRSFDPVSRSGTLMPVKLSMFALIDIQEKCLLSVLAAQINTDDTYMFVCAFSNGIQFPSLITSAFSSFE